MPQDRHSGGHRRNSRSPVLPANHHIRPAPADASACLVMKGSPVRVRASALAIRPLAGVGGTKWGTSPNRANPSRPKPEAIVARSTIGLRAFLACPNTLAPSLSPPPGALPCQGPLRRPARDRHADGEPIGCTEGVAMPTDENPYQPSDLERVALAAVERPPSPSPPCARRTPSSNAEGGRLQLHLKPRYEALPRHVLQLIQPALDRLKPRLQTFRRHVRNRPGDVHRLRQPASLARAAISSRSAGEIRSDRIAVFSAIASSFPIRRAKPMSSRHQGERYMYKSALVYEKARSGAATRAYAGRPRAGRRLSRRGSRDATADLELLSAHRRTLTRTHACRPGPARAIASPALGDRPAGSRTHDLSLEPGVRNGSRDGCDSYAHAALGFWGHSRGVNALRASRPLSLARGSWAPRRLREG